MLETLLVDADLAWLDDAACADMDITDFFVEAGHVIDDAVLQTCRMCPTRRMCAERVYDKMLNNGYFAGLSPGQRRNLSKEQALALIDEEALDSAAGQLVKWPAPGQPADQQVLEGEVLSVVEFAGTLDVSAGPCGSVQCTCSSDRCLPALPGT